MNDNRFALKIFDFSASPNSISERLQLVPTEFGIKGQKRYLQRVRTSSGAHAEFNQSGSSTIWEQNYWGFWVYQKTEEWIGDYFSQFIKKIILPRKEIIAELAKECQIEVTIVQRYYSGYNPGFYFQNDLLKIVYDIGANLDIDVYCLAGIEKGV